MAKRRKKKAKRRTTKKARRRSTGKKRKTKKKKTKSKARRKKTTGRKRRATRRKKTTGRKKRRTTRRKTTGRKKKATRKKRKPNAAFMKPMTPSPALATVVGAKPLPRTQVMKKVWKYIKKNKLQDPKNRRNVRADAKLIKVFKGKKVVSMFQMTKLLSRQLKAAA